MSYAFEMAQNDYLYELVGRYPRLSVCKDSIYAAYKKIETVYQSDGKILVAGNGGSASDADHITGELLKGFVKKRPLEKELAEKIKALTDSDTADYLLQNVQQGLAAIALSNNSAVLTATVNDMSGDIIYAQQVCAYGKKNDAFIGISTSGNSRNVCLAALMAKAKGLATIALTGGSGGKLISLSDVAIIVPETETYKIQELHLPVYHTLCLMLEQNFF
jgi:D-sedoheptulose 7-phosphate isomerase